MDNIRINYETVSSVIGSLKQAVAGSQSASMRRRPRQSRSIRARKRRHCGRYSEQKRS